jgi:cell surface protein SprA
MPYNISTVSIVESFNPLFEARGEFINNLSVGFRLNRTRAINLNIPSQRIIEMSGSDIVIGFGYRIPNFSRFLGRNPSNGTNGSTHTPLDGSRGANDLHLRLDISNQITHTLIRNIEDGFTQATGGLRSTSIRFSADYAMSQTITLRAFFDRMMNQPLISATAFAMVNTSAGVSLRISLF